LLDDQKWSLLTTGPEIDYNDLIRRIITGNVISGCRAFALRILLNWKLYCLICDFYAL